MSRQRSFLRPVGARVLSPAVLTVVGILVIWWIVGALGQFPPFKFPRLETVVSSLAELLGDGTLFGFVATSMQRLAVGFLIGAGLGTVVGLLMVSSRIITSLVRPLVIFFQAIAGIAWIPFAIVWLGLGSGPVIFVVANAVFFIVLFNIIVGVETIPPVLRDAVRALGASRLQMLREVVLPGAMAHLLVGLETGLAFAWRALVAAEVVVASSGIGYLTVDASRHFDSATVVAGIIVIGVLWLAIERLLLRPLKSRTVQRWGLTEPVSG